MMRPAGLSRRESFSLGIYSHLERINGNDAVGVVAKWALWQQKNDFLSNFSSHLKIISETGGVGNNVGVPWEERLTQFMLGNVIYASFPTMATKKTKSFTGMIKTYVVYRVAEDLQKWNYEGCQNPFFGIPGVPCVPPLQTDSVKRFLTPSLMLLSPCAVFVFNSAFVFVLTWLFLGCHPRQWPGARPSAPAYRAPSRPSPVTKGSTFWWGNSPLTRKVRLEEFLHLVQPLANSGPGVLWREGLPISTRREHLKGWSDFLNDKMAAKVVQSLTHSPAQQGEPTQSVFRRRNCDSLFPQGSSEAKKQQLQVEHLGFKMFTSRMIRVGLYCWGMIQHFTIM